MGDNSLSVVYSWFVCPTKTNQSAKRTKKTHNREQQLWKQRTESSNCGNKEKLRAGLRAATVETKKNRSRTESSNCGNKEKLRTATVETKKTESSNCGNKEKLRAELRAATVETKKN